MSTRYRQSTGAPTPAPTPGRRVRNSTTAPTPGRGAAPSRAGTAGPGAASSHRAGDLPPYEPLAHPLRPNYEQQLSQLSHPHNFEALENRVKDMMTCLLDVAAEINEAVSAKEDALNKERQRLAGSQQNGGEAQQRVEQMERELDELRDTVDKTTQQLDRDVRKMIDADAHLTDMRNTLKDLSTDVAAASTQQPHQTQRSQRRCGRDMDDDDDDGGGGGEEEYPDFDPTDPTNAITQSTQPPAVAPSTAFRDRLERARDRYQSRSLVDRYSRSNEYRAFKSAVHESANRDGGKALPPEHLWFSEAGTAAPGQTAAGDDSDDDIQISKATISTKCPLTLQEFRDPVTSRKCPHSFERDAIVSMIDDPNNALRAGGSTARSAPKAVQCPVPGCQSVLSAADLHSDPVLKRKIARIQRANRAAEESDGEEEGDRQRPQSIGSDDDDDAMDVDEDPAMKFKTERRSGRTPAPSQSQRVRGQATVLELDDEEDDEGDEDEDDDD